MNDGYPWGIWIAVDVVVGTALGSGGFAVALLVYVLNRGKLHPLIRPAILTSALFNDPMPKLKTGEYQGLGFHEAPRGTLSHWCVIKDGKIVNYQAVVPSTWNAGPRATGDKDLGPYEAALVGNPIADPEKPLEALRTVHSFDPCLACAIHTVDGEGKEIARVKVL
jgi:Ni,Fe-hydrogenase I large subunit